MSLISPYEAVIVVHVFQSSLRDHGRDSLEREFRTLLNRHSKPVPAEKIMEIIGTEEGTVFVYICQMEVGLK